ncbi:hypothetical protein SRHO_G00091500 [Serrasalmus rhombeus]
MSHLLTARPTDTPRLRQRAETRCSPLPLRLKLITSTSKAVACAVTSIAGNLTSQPTAQTTTSARTWQAARGEPPPQTVSEDAHQGLFTAVLKEILLLRRSPTSLNGRLALSAVQRVTLSSHIRLADRAANEIKRTPPIPLPVNISYPPGEDHPLKAEERYYLTSMTFI